MTSWEQDRGAERHTRQGAARGQKHSLLDEGVPGDPPWRDHFGTPTPRDSEVGPTLAGTGCWCGEGVVGHHGDGPHPGTRHSLREAAVAAAQEGVQAQILRTCAEATARNVGVLVLVDRGRPFWLGPHSSVPPGEVHWRAQAPDPGYREDFSVWTENRR